LPAAHRRAQRFSSGRRPVQDQRCRALPGSGQRPCGAVVHDAAALDCHGRLLEPVARRLAFELEPGPGTQQKRLSIAPTLTFTSLESWRVLFQMSKMADSRGSKRGRPESGLEKPSGALGAFAPLLGQHPASGGPPPLPTGGETIQYQVPLELLVL